LRGSWKRIPDTSRLQESGYSCTGARSQDLAVSSDSIIIIHLSLSITAISITSSSPASFPLLADHPQSPAPHVDVTHSNLQLSPEPVHHPGQNYQRPPTPPRAPRPALIAPRSTRQFPNEQRASAATHQCLSPRSPCSRRIPRAPRMARLASVREFLFDELDDPAALMCGEADFSAAVVARSRVVREHERLLRIGRCVYNLTHQL